MLKSHKNKIVNTKVNLANPVFGSYALKSLRNIVLSAQQLTNVKLFLDKALKKRGCYWIRVIANVSTTCKAEGLRMGKGKGAFKGMVCKLSKGNIVCEIYGLSFKLSCAILKKVSSKLGLFSTIVIKSAC
jgi:large subunit ribosomal protein L16